MKVHLPAVGLGLGDSKYLDATLAQLSLPVLVSSGGVDSRASRHGALVEASVLFHLHDGWS